MFPHRLLFALTLPLLICLSAAAAPSEQVIDDGEVAALSPLG